MQSNLFTKKEIRRINYCRLYLQVLTISDICNAQGTFLAKNIYQGLNHPTQSISLLEEPLQEWPGEHVLWALWRRFLKHITYEKQQLRRPLGPWYKGLSKRRWWPAYESTSTQQLFRIESFTGKKPSHYAVHSKIRTCIFAFSHSQIVDTLPEDAIPVDEEVRGACEILGFDPLYVANEGKLIAAVPAADAGAVLAAMRAHPLGARAASLGRVVGEHPRIVTMRSSIGSMRIVDMLSGEQLPRIC